MDIFIIGMTGAIGGLLAQKLVSRGGHRPGACPPRRPAGRPCATGHSRPCWRSLLVDAPGVGAVSLGPAEFHGQIIRDDVAETLVGLLHEPRIGRQIQELNEGLTPIAAAVASAILSHTD